MHENDQCGEVSNRTFLTVFAIAILLGFSTSLQVRVHAQSLQASTDEEIGKERRFFDFLIGEWRIERSETPDGAEVGGDSIYKFSRVLDGNGIGNQH